LVIGGAAWGISAGMAALAVWRLESRAPVTLLICGAIGAALCIAMPMAIRGETVSRDTWMVAIAGGLLFAAFLMLAARYMRMVASASDPRGRP
jgi:hypothetical protein